MSTNPFRLVFDVDDPVLQRRIRECEADVFLTRFGNTPEELAEEYDSYPNMHWIGVLTQDNQAVGSIRMWLPSDGRTKTLDDIARAPWFADPDESARIAGLDRASTCDGGTIAVRATDLRAGRNITWALLHALFQVPLVNGVDSMVFMIDAVADNRLHDVGLHFLTLPGTSAQPYFGSASSRPVYAHLGELLAVQRREHPDVYRGMVLGQGLEGIDIPPREAFVVPGYARKLA